MQLEQQETFTIHGPQLEILGEVETKLPAPAKKRGVASLVLVALALVSVFGIGGARLKGTQTAAVAAYTAAQVVAEAGTILGEDNAAVQQAQKAVNEYIGDISRQQPTVHSEMINAVELAYKTAHAQREKQDRRELDIAHDEFTSYENIIVREYLTKYNKYAAVVNSTAFPTAQLGALWGVEAMPTFTLLG